MTSLVTSISEFPFYYPMLNQLLAYFLPSDLDTADWSAYSKARYLIFGHLVTILVAVLGIVVNSYPHIDRQPLLADTIILLLMVANLYVLKKSFPLSRVNFYVIVWVTISILSVYVNSDWDYEYYYLVMATSSVILFSSEVLIVLVFLLGSASFYLSHYLNGTLQGELNLNPAFIFVMSFLIFRFFYSTNRYYIRVIDGKNSQLERDKELIVSQAKKIEEISTLKSRFFTNISHDIRTPLTLIAGPLKELMDDASGLSREQDRKLRMAGNNTKRLVALVDEILDLSKLDDGQLPLHVSPANLGQFIEGLAGSFEHLAKIKKIQLDVAVEPGIGDVWFDKDGIERIVMNLLSNAFKFSEDGATIQITLRKAGNEKVELKVSDTGRGISSDQLPHIFERFYHTESDMQGSSGIGLSIVKAMIDRMGGTIEVGSEPGKGTVFSVVLPVGRSHCQPGDIQPVARPEKDEIVEHSGGLLVTKPTEATLLLQGEAGSSSRKKILIVEDNEELRQFLAQMLTAAFDVAVASDGEEGVKIASGQLPDLVVSDVMMPGKSGYELCRELKEDVVTSHIPVILLTARADKGSKLRGLEVLADDFITKPFDRDELLARITNLLETRRQLVQKFRHQSTIIPEDENISSLDRRFLQKVLQAIATNFSNELYSVEQLGADVGLSRSQLNRKLQALTGLSPNSMIREARLEKAVELLQKNAGTAAEVAYMTGFSSPNYFSKCFHNKFGFPPGEARKRGGA